MNKNLIYQAIQHPEILRDLATDDLERLTKEHPWFSAAHLLLAKKYQVESDYRFTDQLHTAAMLSGNRTLLYRYLRSKPAAEVQDLKPETLRAEEEKGPLVRPELPEAHELEDLLEQQEAFFDVFSAAPSPTRLEEEQPIAFDEPEAPSIRDANMGTLADRMLAEDQEYKAEPTISSSFESTNDPLPELRVTPGVVEQAHEESGIEKSQLLTTGVVSDAAESKPPMDSLDREILINALHKSIELEVSEHDDAEELSEPATQQEAETRNTILDDGVPSDPYTAWLQRRSLEIQYTPAKLEVAKPPALEPAQQTGPSEEATQGISHGVDRMQTPGKMRQQRDLIDRFIQQEPKISQGKAADYTGMAFGKESLEDSLGLVTETMAKLYAAQGKIDKARKAYRRLIELHPEKSVYFAAQLKNLNTKK